VSSTHHHYDWGCLSATARISRHSDTQHLTFWQERSPPDILAVAATFMPTFFWHTIIFLKSFYFFCVVLDID
jgi:hypothetical protein